MAIPKSPDARRFYRSADERWTEAQILRRADRTTAAIYLAGYAIECMLKALILEGLPEKSRNSVLSSFRGRQAHDFQWLRDRYILNGGAKPPKDINRQFTLVEDWSTEIRYDPKKVAGSEADQFLKAVQAIIHWANGRL